MRLLDYIRGLRKGKEAHRLEKESMKDALLADAMDGYQQVEGNHEQRIEQLQKQVSIRTSRKRNTYAIGWSIAACLVIGFGVTTYFLFLKKEVTEEIFIAQTATEQKDESITPTLPEAEVDSKVKPGTSVSPRMIARAETCKMKQTVSGAEGSEMVTSTFQEEAKEKAMAINAPADSSQTTPIAMNENKEVLNEVVVVGYASQKKYSVTGSVATPKKEIKEEKLRTSDPLIGRRKYKEYLEENLIHPTDNECNEVKGNVTLSFFVDTEGNPYRIVVIKGLCKSADKEAIRLIKEGPKWTKSILPVKIKVKF